MTTKNEIVVTYKDGSANVHFGNNTLSIGRSDDASREYLCPVELVSSALGT